MATAKEGLRAALLDIRAKQRLAMRENLKVERRANGYTRKRCKRKKGSTPTVNGCEPEAGRGSGAPGEGG